MKKIFMAMAALSLSLTAAHAEEVNIGFTANAFANLNQDKFFWRNAANVNLTWVKLDDKDKGDI